MKKLLEHKRIVKAKTPSVKKGTIRVKDGEGFPKKEAKEVKAAVVCIAKLENQYISEWVDYHLGIGFDHVYVCDNNLKDGERIEDALTEKQLEKVTVIDYRGRVSGNCSVQNQSYTSTYREYSSLYDWMFFIDCDEFITLAKHPSIKEYLSEEIFRSFKTIRLHWLCYGDNGLVENDGRPVLERFTTPSGKKYVVQHKSAVRGGLPNVRMVSPHVTNRINGVCNNVGTYECYTGTCNTREPNYDWAYIRHYITKSTKEYVENKKRKWVKGVCNARLSQRFYWNYNDKTTEKEDIIAKLK